MTAGQQQLGRSDRDRPGAVGIDLVGAAAENLAAQTDTMLRGLGATPVHTDDLWSCGAETGGPFPAAITLRPDADPAELRARIAEVVVGRRGPVGVIDNWSMLDLRDLGFEPSTHTHHVRAPGLRAGSQRVTDLLVRRVESPEVLAVHERVDAIGFGSKPPPTPHAWYAPPVLEEDRLHLYLGYRAGDAVAVSQAVIAAGIVGIYGVATLPTHRRQGCGEAMTWAAIATAPELPAVLQPMPEGKRMYERMGFLAVAEFTRWHRPRAAAA